jgi:hypothetical protein
MLVWLWSDRIHTSTTSCFNSRTILDHPRNISCFSGDNMKVSSKDRIGNPGLGIIQFTLHTTPSEDVHDMLDLANLFAHTKISTSTVSTTNVCSFILMTRLAYRPFLVRYFFSPPLKAQCLTSPSAQFRISPRPTFSNLILSPSPASG